MATKINGNQIQATTRGLVEAWSVSEQLNLPPLNQSQINALGTPAFGTLVYNTTEDQAQIYLQDANAGNPGWDDVGGGGPSIGEGSIIRTNGTTISENLTVGPVFNGGVEFTNGFSAGPIEIAQGNTVTIENNASWMIMGDDDLSYAEFVDIESQHATFTGTLHFSETKEAIYYYTASGTVTHNYNNGNTIWVYKTGGSNFTLQMTNVPTDGPHGYGFTVVVQSQGGAGLPTSITINGQSTAIYWSGGNVPGMDGTYAVCSFSAAYITNSNNHAYTVFGSAVNYS